MHQGDCKCEALLEAQWEVATGGIRKPAQLEFVQRPLDPLALTRSLESVGAAEKA